MRQPKIAIATEFLNQYGGAQKQLEVVLELFPEAPIYTAKIDLNCLSDYLKSRKIIYPKETWISKLSQFFFVFLMAPIFENFDFREYDIVISDGTTWTKGIITRPDQLHISTILTPPRFLYGYSTESTKRDKWYFKLPFSYLDNILRLWDFAAARRPDHLIAISKEIQRRIQKFYRLDSHLIYPPVDINYKTNTAKPIVTGPYYLMVGRLAAYKNFQLVIQAFKNLDIKLVLAGTGFYEKNLKTLAEGCNNIIFLGRVSEDAKHNLMEHCIGVINPVDDEDFGIVPVEAMAHGKPVLAHKSGGHLETVVEGISGMFFSGLGVEEFKTKFAEFDKAIQEDKFDAQKIQATTAKFSKERYQQEFKDFVMTKWFEFQNVK